MDDDWDDYEQDLREFQRDSNNHSKTNKGGNQRGY